ncbi:unnamed protein product [Eruca vesicaria subsp. sativa]|uniref:Uncharacterized protein n=1 Tax=Eruca vesicaria subsp. sativa TaxID=29727 RepID=A0ABC8KI74_ERUVS|nr:unnamed protein product [Eruca vesicaria subsp. sativa]
MMNPSNDQLRVHKSTRRLSPSEGMGNKVTVSFGSTIEDIHEDPVTGIRTWIQTSNPTHNSTFLISFSIESTCHSHIAHRLFSSFMNIPSSDGDVSARPVGTVTWICDLLAPRIASAASELGFGTNGFEIDLVLIHARERVSAGLSPLCQEFSSLQL